MMIGPIASQAGVGILGAWSGVPPYWDTQRFLSDASAAAYAAQTGITAKDRAAAGVVTLAQLIAAGFTGSGGANGQVMGRSGQVQAATAPRMTFDRGATENRLLATNDLLNTTVWWNFVAGAALAPVRSASAEIGPDGAPCFVIRLDCGSSASSANRSAFVQTLPVLNGDHRVRLRVKAETPADVGKTVRVIWESFSGGEQIVALTADWRLIEIVGNMPNIQQNLILECRGTYTTQTAGFVISAPQIHSGLLPKPFLSNPQTTGVGIFSSGTPLAQNLIPGIADIESAGWEKQTGVSVVSTSVADASGGTTARRIDLSAAVGGTGFYGGSSTLTSTVKGCTYTRRIKIRAVSGSGPIAINDPYFSGANSVFTVNSTSWTTCYYSGTGDASGTVALWVKKVDGTTPAQIDVCECQGYEGTADLPYLAGPTSSYPQLGLVVEGAQTEQVLQNSGLTQAAWIRTGASVALAPGLRGSYTANRVTATAANACVFQPVTLASAAVIQNVCLRRRNGTGKVHQIVGAALLTSNSTFDTNIAGWLANAGTATWVTGGRLSWSVTSTGSFVYQSAGAVSAAWYLYKIVVTSISGGSIRAALNGTSAIGPDISAPGTYYALLTGSGANGNVSIESRGVSGTLSVELDELSVMTLTTREITSGLMPYFCYPAADDSAARANPYVGLILETSGDVVDVDHIACRTGGGAILTPIYTSGGAVTRSADVVKVPKSATPLSDGAGTLLVSGRLASLTAGVADALVSMTSSVPAYKHAGGAAGAYDGTNLALTAATVTAGQRITQATAWGGLTLATSANGAATVTAAFDGAMNGADLWIGGGEGFLTSNPSQIVVERLAFKAAAAPSADLAAASAGNK